MQEVWSNLDILYESSSIFISPEFNMMLLLLKILSNGSMTAGDNYLMAPSRAVTKKSPIKLSQLQLLNSNFKLKFIFLD